MPNWMLIHGTLLVIWVIVYIFVYYMRVWSISVPFSRKTSMKVIFICLLPLSWLVSSVTLGITLYFFGSLISSDIVFLVILPIVFLLIYGFYFWLSNLSYIKHQKQIHKSLEYFRNSCKEWTNQYSFINDSNFDLEIYISKGKPVGRIIIFGLNLEEETILKNQQEKAPLGLSIMFAKKKWILNRWENNISFEN